MVNYSLIENAENVEVKLEGDLDIEGTEVIEEQLVPSLQKYKEVTLNFEEVPFVDSSGIGLLISLVQTLSGMEIKVTIGNVREDIQEVFELLQLSEILGEGVFI
jgi:anti-sigma B factor antagonist/stage II sporulation protein AA (anti-sigma F factor antagonist)